MEFKKQHVVLFPFMAQGHITPFLLLADLIHKTYPNYTLTLVNTPLNIQNIQSSLPPSSKINLKSLPFDPTAHGLPSGAESTATAPCHLISSLLQASETLQPAFEQLIISIAKEDSKSTPPCIISNNFLAWTVDVARKLGAFHAIFFTGGAYGTAIMASLWKHLPRTKTASEEILLPEFPHVRLHRSQLEKSLTLATANGSDGFSIFLQRQFQLCSRTDCALVNTVEEFERLGLSMLKLQFNLQLVFPIGPLSMPSASNPIEMNLLQWLDSNLPASVLYISFGSQNSIDTLQMMQLAMALELSSIPFIWVIRPPVGFDIKGEFRPEWLPEGFEERMRTTKRGFTVHEWAPQVEILSHPSTGAFLSHCGWNSVLESLVQGVPIVGWPLSAEQFYSSKFLEEEVGVCVEVARGGGESSTVNKEEIGRGIEVVMSNEEMRRKAKEIGQVMRGAMKEKEDDDGGSGSSFRGLKEFFKVAFSK